jgi:hypothetical protein
MRRLRAGFRAPLCRLGLRPLALRLQVSQLLRLRGRLLQVVGVARVRAALVLVPLRARLLRMLLAGLCRVRLQPREYLGRCCWWLVRRRSEPLAAASTLLLRRRGPCSKPSAPVIFCPVYVEWMRRRRLNSYRRR